MTVYRGIFTDRFDIEQEFQVKLEDSIEILFAFYDYESYEGDAYVLFRQHDKLYEVYGGHCSCYGLEGQWSPEDTTIEFLKTSPKFSYMMGPEDQHAMLSVIEELESA